MSIDPLKLADRYWRLNNLYYIMDKRGQRVLFRFNYAQRVLYRMLWCLNIILKARQLGMTTFICILMLDDCLFTSNVKAGIIAHNREDAEDFFENKVKYPYENLPEALIKMRPVKSDTLRELSFNNNSSIRVGTSLRSGTFQWLHVSEFGKICAKYPDKAREIVTGALNTVHTGQHIFIESTAEGNDGYFFEYCQKAEKMERDGIPLTIMDFKFFFFPWWEDPEYCLEDKFVPFVEIPREMRDYFKELEINDDIKLSPGQKAWYVKKSDTQKKDMNREYPSTVEEAFSAQIEGCFFAKTTKRHRRTVASGAIGKLVKDRFEEFDFIEDIDGDLEIWRYPYSTIQLWQGSHWENRYVIGSDIGEGLEQDYSVAHVYDRLTGEYVARMRSNRIDSVRWAKMLMELSKFYRNYRELEKNKVEPVNCMIVPERTGSGITVCKQLDDAKDINVYTMMVPAKVGHGLTKQVGWVESKAAKFDLAGDLKEYFSSTKAKVYDSILLNECAVFVHKPRFKGQAESLGAEAGFNDDTVISAGLALQGHYYLEPVKKIVEYDIGWRDEVMAQQSGEESAWVA